MSERSVPRPIEEQLAQARELLRRHILEHVETEEALRASEERWRSYVERAAHGILVATPAGDLEDVNPALVAMLEYPSAEAMRGANLWRGLFYDQAEAARLHDAALAGTLPAWVETRWRRRSGAPVAVRLSLRAVHGPSGAVEHVEAMAEDITERRRQEELLRRSERMAALGGTIAGIAHELNNPLAAIIGFAQILLSRPLPAEDRESVVTIHEEAARTARIVKDLLQLLRTREREERSAVDLNDVVGHVARGQAGGVPLAFDLDARLPAVLGDRAQLEQAVGNLLDNAARATAERGAADGGVLVRTRREGTDVLLEVEDDGPGIPPDVADRIWDPFWSSRAEGEGRGLGLSVVHGIVVQHGGHVTAQGRPEGGALFAVRLPAVEGG